MSPRSFTQKIIPYLPLLMTRMPSQNLSPMLHPLLLHLRVLCHTNRLQYQLTLLLENNEKGYTLTYGLPPMWYLHPQELPREPQKVHPTSPIPRYLPLAIHSHNPPCSRQQIPTPSLKHSNRRFRSYMIPASFHTMTSPLYHKAANYWTQYGVIAARETLLATLINTRRGFA